MKINTYDIYDVLAKPAWFVVRICNTWTDWLWNLCHYQYGNGPKGVPHSSLIQVWKDQKHKD